MRLSSSNTQNKRDIMKAWWIKTIKQGKSEKLKCKQQEKKRENIGQEIPGFCQKKLVQKDRVRLVSPTNQVDKLATILKKKTPKMSCTKQPIQVAINLMDIIKNKCNKQTAKKQPPQAENQSREQSEKQKATLSRQIKVQVLDMNQDLIQREIQSARNRPIEQSFSKEQYKKSKTHSQNQDTLIVSEEMSDTNASNQLKLTQKRSIQLQSSTPSTIADIKSQPSENPIDNLQILQKLITQKIENASIKLQQEQKQDEGIQNQQKENQTDYQNGEQKTPVGPGLAIPNATKKATLKIINVQILSACRSEITSPRQIIKRQLFKQNLQKQWTKQRNQIQDSKPNKIIRQTKQRKDLPLQKRLQPQKTMPRQLDICKINKAYKDNLLKLCLTPQFNRKKTNLLYQIQNRPDINQSFLDPFENISSVFEEMQKSSLNNSSQEITQDMQNLLNFTYKEYSSEYFSFLVEEKKD